MHTFTISVHLQGEGSDWGSDLVPLVVEAYNLHDALELALAAPLHRWFPPDDDD